MDEIPEYGGQSTWPSVIAMIGPKACLDLQIRVCDKEKVSCSEQSFGLWHDKAPIWKKNPKPKNFAKNTHYLQVKTINYKEKKKQLSLLYANCICGLVLVQSTACAL